VQDNRFSMPFFLRLEGGSANVPIINPDLIDLTQSKLRLRLYEGGKVHDDEKGKEKEAVMKVKDQYVGMTSAQGLIKRTVARRGYRTNRHPMLRWMHAYNDPFSAAERQFIKLQLAVNNNSEDEKEGS